MKSGKAVGSNDLPLAAYGYLYEREACDWMPRKELCYRMRKLEVAEKYLRVV